MTTMTQKYAETIVKLSQGEPTIDTCFAAGFDCGKNGINLFNADFRYFSTHDRMQAWEAGKKMGEDQRDDGLDQLPAFARQQVVRPT